MNEKSLSPDDPLITAYALGELGAPERARIEAAVASDPLLAATVDEIRATSGQLQAALASEAAPAAIPLAIPRRRPRRWLRFPAAYFLIGGLAAAAFAVVMILVEPPPRAALPKKTYVEVPLEPARAPTADAGTIAATAGETSVFSPGAGTAALARLREALDEGRLPPPGTVNAGALVNAFSSRPPSSPTQEAENLSVVLDVAAAPWEPAHRLVRVGLQAHEAAAANLVFVIDGLPAPDGSEALPRLRDTLRALVRRLQPRDRVALVVVGDEAGHPTLASTPGERSGEILGAIERIEPRGRGAAARTAALAAAYETARAGFVAGGLNRVVLCTDPGAGWDRASLEADAPLAAAKAREGVGLSVLDFGRPAPSDGALQRLAEAGGGRYAAVDAGAPDEPARVAGLQSDVAADVQLQLAFDPSQVAAYRMIGGGGFRPAREQDEIGVGNLAAGRVVTALYEIVPAVPPDGAEKPGDGGTLPSAPLLTVQAVYRALPDGAPRERTLRLADARGDFSAASADFRFSAAVAGFGLALQAEPVAAPALADLRRWAESAAGVAPGGRRAAFLDLVSRAQAVVP